MITDVRASKMFLLRHENESVASIARRLKMGEKTVRKYRAADRLPSQIERTERAYRTREDPLAEYWSEIAALLEQDPRLKPYAILDWLKQKYNPPQGEPRLTDSIRRTFERRVGRPSKRRETAGRRRSSWRTWSTRNARREIRAAFCD